MPPQLKAVIYLVHPYLSFLDKKMEPGEQVQASCPLGHTDLTQALKKKPLEIWPQEGFAMNA